ncbi:MAG: hypothetical protein NVSMB19_06160 [Vulcanimicrobiaceae bacterium]
MKFRRIFVGAFVFAFAAAATPGVRASDASPSERERTFLAAPTAEGALATAREANARAHFPGTPGDHAFATYMRDRLSAAGFESSLETFRGRIDRPRQIALELIDDSGTPTRRFDLREGPVKSDADGARSDVDVPYNYGSADGDVRAPLLYVNHGLDADYERLATNHLSPRGRIVIVRYGAEFRGLLAERAQRNGAVAVIFYSDPRDGGDARGRAYPDGPWRPSTTVQRGMVSRGALKIPTLPVSAKTAEALLYASARHGRAHLIVRLDRQAGTMWNTVGVMRGSTAETVVLGGHRDAWVYGVTDNGSGIATLLEVARGFGALAQTGWRPRRSIVIAGFDAEEIGELGSQAYVAAHRADLRAHAIAYLNADENVTGPKFSASAVAALGETIVTAARDLGIANVPATPAVPGGGSDHESFLFGLGIPTAEIAYAGSLPVYHSAYDDLGYATRVIDPGFGLHRAAARALGLVALRLADAETVPYRFGAYVEPLRAATASLASEQRVQPGVLAELEAAIGRFQTSALAFDRARSTNSPAQRAIDATRGLDLALYGANGYAQASFPAIRAAIAANDPAAIRSAVRGAAGTMDATVDLLAR